MNNYYPNYHEPKYRFLTDLIFEVNSWIGRRFFKKKSRFTPLTKPFLVDIGVGMNYTEGWTHVDFYKKRVSLSFIKKQTHAKTIKKRFPEVETDLRYPLNCSSGIVDGIYSGHTLEHLYPNHAYHLLGELFRVLKPGCWLRINVPDLGLCVDYYNGKNNIWSYKFKAEAIGNLTQNYGHHSVWDEELLIGALKDQGFINIKKVRFGEEGVDKRLIKEEEVRKYETLVVEAQKPL